MNRNVQVDFQEERKYIKIFLKEKNPSITDCHLGSRGTTTYDYNILDELGEVT